MQHLFFMLAALLLPILGWSETSYEDKQELFLIEQQLTALKNRLHGIQLQDMNKEVDSQEFMIADWNKYGEKMQKVRDLEKEALDVQRQIDHLEQRRTKLLEKSAAGAK